MFRFIFGLFAALCVFAASAQPVPATDPVPRVAFPVTHVGNISTVGPRTADAANAAKFSYGVASNGAIFANTADRMPTPGGASIPIGVNGTISKPRVAAALGRFASKALPFVSVGSALYDLFEELDVTVSGGQMVVPTPAPGGYYDAYEYRDGTGPWSHDWESACVSRIARQRALDTDPANSYSGPTGFTLVNSTQGSCRYTLTTPFGTSNQSLSIGVRPQTSTPPPLGNQPMTEQEFVDRVAAKSGWPTSSALARATVDAIKYGEALEVEPQTVTGPATSPGSTTVTVNSTNNTTETRTSTNQHTYAGPQVSTQTVTTVVTTDTTTGAELGRQTITETPVIPSTSASGEPAPFVMPCGVAGTPPCAVKVDETGTPEQVSELANPEQLVKEKAFSELEDLKADPEGFWPALPEMSWTFALPTHCGPIAVPAFSPYLEQIDICQWQPLFHQLMTIVWVVGGLFGAIGSFWRNVFATN